jgi:hypothetical protein
MSISKYTKTQLIEMIEDNPIVTRKIKYKNLTKQEIIKNLLEHFVFENGKFYYIVATKDLNRKK